MSELIIPGKTQEEDHPGMQMIQILKILDNRTNDLHLRVKRLEEKDDPTRNGQEDISAGGQDTQS